VLPVAHYTRSSAYCKLVYGRFMSQRNREKRRQLRTAPCGRPLVIEVLGEEAEPTQTMKLRFSIKDSMKDTSLAGCSGWEVVVSIITWSSPSS